MTDDYANHTLWCTMNIYIYVYIHYITLHCIALHCITLHYIPTYLPTYRPTDLPTYLHTYIPTYLRTYVPTYLRTYVPTYLHTYIPTYLPTYLHTYMNRSSVNLNLESLRGYWLWGGNNKSPDSGYAYIYIYTDGSKSGLNHFWPSNHWDDSASEGQPSGSQPWCVGLYVYMVYW